VVTSLAVTGGVAQLNPAVTVGLASMGAVDWADVPTLIAGQFVGAFLGAILVYLAYLAHWSETEDPGLKLAVFSTGPAIRNTAANLITEIIGTALLVFGVVAIAIKLGGGFLIHVSVWPADDRRHPRNRRTAGRPSGPRYRHVARWSDGLRDQPGP
jgi:glycerol uptake facilitator-like aquaporin